MALRTSWVRLIATQSQPSLIAAGWAPRNMPRLWRPTNSNASAGASRVYILGGGPNSGSRSAYLSATPFYPRAKPGPPRKLGSEGAAELLGPGLARAEASRWGGSPTDWEGALSTETPNDGYGNRRAVYGRPMRLAPNIRTARFIIWAQAICEVWYFSSWRARRAAKRAPADGARIHLVYPYCAERQDGRAGVRIARLPRGYLA